MKTARLFDVLRGKTQVHGTGVLVDRLWPRGVSKESMAEFMWLKDVAPSSELRTWFDHDPNKFAEFARRYRQELDANDSEDLARLLALDQATLLYAARDSEHNHAQVLAQWCEKC